MTFRIHLFFVCSAWLLFAAVGWSAPAAETRTALVIGNARYESAVGALRNSGHDAAAVAKTLRGLGFAVIEKRDVTRDQLLRAVLAFRTTLADAEVGVFYFAGHGISVAGANYLIPIKSDYHPDGADQATLRMLAETHLFNVEQAATEMKSAGARCNLLILDACRTTALAAAERTRGVTNRGGLVEMKPPAGSLIAFAADVGQTAFDGDGPNGLYTEELLKNLRTPGLTIEQVFKRTRAGVLERSAGGQLPAEYSRLVGEDIFLAGPPAAAAPPPPEPVVMKAEPVAVPSLRQIQKLAASGKAVECVTALGAMARSQGAGDFAAEPLAALLDAVKEDLRAATTPSPKIVAAVATCEMLLRAIPECLPPTHASTAPLTAKAHNRRGDALLLLDRASESVKAFDAAHTLAPDDAYVLYNRGRAHLRLGHPAEARADFTAASDPRGTQPTARKLAQQALAKMPL
ncbi:MAG: caspase family protein [Chthoniobacter sp.]|nr:caspase family protein [Chthoniobacter sp.]